MGKMDDGSFHEGQSGVDDPTPTKVDKILTKALFDENIRERVLKAAGDGISFEDIAAFVSENNEITIRKILEEFENDTF
jgi:hypothetical protein